MVPIDAVIRKVVFVLNGHDLMLRRWAAGYLCDAMRGFGIDAKIVDIAKENDSKCDGADLVVVYRCFDLRTIRVMRRVRIQGAFVVFFLDDYLFQPDCRYTGGCPFTTDSMAEADVLMSSSAELLKRMPLDKPKILRRSVLDAEAMGLLRQEYRRTGEFSIGWPAGAGRGTRMDGFIHEFLREMESRLEGEERCIFHCFGRRVFEGGKRVVVGQNVYFGGKDWQGFYTKMRSFDLGVVINPLDEKDEFWWCKSELKFVESGAMGVPLVTSRVPPYLELIKDGVNGFLASTPSEFADKVVELMRNEELSRRMSVEVYRTVKEDYDVVRNARKFLDDVAAARVKLRRDFV